jgi:hypothetical protein
LKGAVNIQSWNNFMFLFGFGYFNSISHLDAVPNS